MNKFILGTAQFGTNYGISNTSGVNSFNTANKIITLAQDEKIKFIDTAINYEASQQILKKINLDYFKVISKLPEISEKNLADEEYIINIVENSLNNLGIKKYHCILLHRPLQLLTDRNRKIVKSLNRLKSTGMIDKIGISIYSPDELESVINIMDLDIVQAPLNILDQRMYHSGWLAELDKQGIQFHARSIFLQGLLLMTKERMPNKFNQYEKIWTKWHKWLSIKKLSPLETCLNFVNNINHVNKIVIGIQSEKQLIEIMNIQRRDISDLPNLYKMCNNNLLNPSLWSSLN